MEYHWVNVTWYYSSSSWAKPTQWTVFCWTIREHIAVIVMLGEQERWWVGGSVQTAKVREEWVHYRRQSHVTKIYIFVKWLKLQLNQIRCQNERLWHFSSLKSSCLQFHTPTHFLVSITGRRRLEATWHCLLRGGTVFFTPLVFLTCATGMPGGRNYDLLYGQGISHVWLSNWRHHRS